MYENWPWNSAKILLFSCILMTVIRNWMESRGHYLHCVFSCCWLVINLMLLILLIIPWYLCNIPITGVDTVPIIGDSMKVHVFVWRTYDCRTPAARPDSFTPPNTYILPPHTVAAAECTALGRGATVSHWLVIVSYLEEQSFQASLITSYSDFENTLH